MAVNDDKFIRRVRWQFVVLDEAQAIKNAGSLRWQTLLALQCRNRLLMTGTPIQNSMAELWALLHFIMPEFFDSHEDFDEWFAADVGQFAEGDESARTAHQIRRLHLILSPFLLRRVKKDVEHEMVRPPTLLPFPLLRAHASPAQAPKIEVQLNCSLSARQSALYAELRRRLAGGAADANGGDALLGARASSELGDNDSEEEAAAAAAAAGVSAAAAAGGVGGGGNGGGGAVAGERDSLMNLVMQFRKVCNHPMLFSRRLLQAPFVFASWPDLAPPPQHVLVKASARACASPSLAPDPAPPLLPRSACPCQWCRLIAATRSPRSCRAAWRRLRRARWRRASWPRRYRRPRRGGGCWRGPSRC
jgi:DNA helicase INO80